MRRLLPDPAELDDAGLVEAYRPPAGRHLRVNFVASLDGSFTVDGRSEGLGTPGDKRIFDLLRALADVVLVGHGTASAEGYGPISADSAVGRLRSALGRPATAPIAVVSRRASLDPGGACSAGRAGWSVPGQRSTGTGCWRRRGWRRWAAAWPARWPGPRPRPGCSPPW